jgi:hypothetical protein
LVTRRASRSCLLHRNNRASRPSGRQPAMVPCPVYEPTNAGRLLPQSASCAQTSQEQVVRLRNGPSLDQLLEHQVFQTGAVFQDVSYQLKTNQPAFRPSVQQALPTTKMALPQVVTNQVPHSANARGWFRLKVKNQAQHRIKAARGLGGLSWDGCVSHCGELEGGLRRHLTIASKWSVPHYS